MEQNTTLMPQTPSLRARRREVLSVVAGASVASLAGCTGGVSDAGERPLAENPVADGIDDRPGLGPGRESTEITLVGFSDPSCGYCASFHEETLPEIESEWVEAGRATVYDRWYPVVAEWGESAIHGLVEVHRQQRPEQYRALASSYFEHQDELSEETLVEHTRSVLDGSAVDVEAVTRAIEDRSHGEYVSADVAAAEAAGVSGTPTTFVFVEGEWVTAVRGDAEFERFRTAVESHG